MSSSLPESLWIHIGECPCCVNGLCRVRGCQDSSGTHLYAMCDECEALWVEPSTNGPRCFPDIDDPRCPICNLPLYGPQAHWAEAQELLGTAWSEVAIFDLPSADEPSSEENSDVAMPYHHGDGSGEQFLTADDIADALDAPAILPPSQPEPSTSRLPDSAAAVPATTTTEPVQQHFTVGEPLPGESDAAYGQDEPKPGC
jgi:hypothetical protein